MPDTIDPEQLKPALPHADLIDVRTPAEYREIHVRGAHLIPLTHLSVEAVRDSRPSDAEGPTYVVCQSGVRAGKAVATLTAAGHEAVVVAGGTDACIAAGLPVVRGQAAMSLERQVRIAAGSLVVIGVSLGVLVSPWWLLLAGFVGAGLIFAGVTNTCGMGMLLAKLPWNR
jgi:rhodanese-related sulfurtransferase